MFVLFSSLRVPNPFSSLRALHSLSCYLRISSLSFIKLHKTVIHVIIWLAFCGCGFHSVCPRMKLRALCKLPDGRDWLWGKLGLALMIRAIVSIPLIQFSADGWGCVLSL